MDFRERVAAARDEGMGTAEVAELFGCCPAWVRRLMQRRRETESLEPVQRKMADQRKLDEQERQRLRRFIEKNPDATLRELICALGLKIHSGTLCRTLKAMDLPLKKSPCTPRNRTGRM
jgi:transposase